MTYQRNYVSSYEEHVKKFLIQLHKYFAKETYQNFGFGFGQTMVYTTKLSDYEENLLR